MKYKILILLLFTITSLYAQTLKIGYEPYLPLTSQAGEKPEGYGIEILRKVYAKHELVFQLIPYSRGLKMLEDGKIDMLFGAATFDFKNPKNIVVPKESIDTSVMTFFTTTKNPWVYNNSDSLKGIRLGLVNGYEYPSLQKIQDKSNFIYISGNDTTVRNLTKLLLNRINVLYEAKNVVLYTAKQLGTQDRIKENISLGEPLPIYCVLSQKTENAQQLADEFDANLQKLRASKELSTILKTYNLPDWK
jgi:polar amino acid transport system substrate-binding protein